MVQDNHIAELVAHGIPAPSRIPIALELSPYLLRACLKSQYSIGIKPIGGVEFVS